MNHGQIVQDERLATARQRHLAKARKARRRQLDALIWREISAYRKVTGCKCDLRPGMSWAELVALGEGCTEPGDGSGYVCPALDMYRSRVKR